MCFFQPSNDVQKKINKMCINFCAYKYLNAYIRVGTGKVVEVGKGAKEKKK